MQQPIPNNDQNSDWRSRLEDETAFPGEAFINSNAAWNTLYNRLHTARRKKAVWYWIAAASILAVVTSVFLLQPAIKHQEITTAKTAQKATVSINNPVLQNETAALPQKKDMVTQVTAAPKKAKWKAVAQKNKELTVSLPVPVKETEEHTGIVPSKEEEKTQASEQLASVQVKPALKVVHVNELGPGIPSNSTRQTTDYSLLRIGTSSKTTVPAGKIGIQISTAKTSPVN